MARVPVYPEGGGVALRGIATNARTGPSEAPGALVGRAVEGVGQALGQVADTSAQIMSLQAETRARDTDTALSDHIQQSLTTGDNALEKLQGQAFVDAAPTVLKGIQDKAKELSNQPRNALEARMLKDITARRLSEVQGRIGGQVVREAQFANKAAAVSRTDTLGASAAYSYSDGTQFAKAKADLDAAIRDQLHVQGIDDPASFQALRREKLTAVHTFAVQSMMNKGDTGGAQAWLDDAIAKQEIDPAAAVQYQERLEKATTENEISNLVEGVAAPSIVDGKVGRAPPELVAAVVYQESRGNGLAVSPKGAQGVAQVMPATGPEAAQLAGLPWQPERMQSRNPADIQYQKALGEAYLNRKLKDNGGNVVMALAAYNAGQKRVDQWVKQFGDPRTGAISGSAWAAKIPFAETKDYVAKITAKLGGTTRTPLPPGIMDAGQAEAWVAQFPVKDRAAARSAAMSKVSLNRGIKSQRESDAWDAVQPYIQNGQPWTAIPKTLWGRVDPEHQTALMEAARRGTNRVTSPEAWDTVFSIAESNPEAFKTMDLLKLAPDFAPGDFEQLRKMQHQAKMGTGEWKKPVAQYSVVTRNMQSVAPPSIAKRPAKDPTRVAFQNQWFQAVQAKQATQQEPLTDDEVNEIGTRLTAEQAIGKGLFGGTKTAPLYEFAIGQGGHETKNYNAIPAAEQTKVFEFLQRRNGRTPKVGEVLETWRTLKATGDL